MSERKPTFFTSDWHIGHANSIVFDKRPFKDLDHMHRVLINNFNACVPEDGVCYFLGDVGFSSAGTTKKVVEQLNGTKVLIMGNHDKGVNAMYNNGFSVVLHKATIYISGKEVTLTHCPLRGVFREDLTHIVAADPAKAARILPTDKWHGESRNQAFSTDDHGQFHLHGHIHSGPANTKLKIDGRQMDIGAPANGYRPVSISVIESWLAGFDKK